MVFRRGQTTPEEWRLHHSKTSQPKLSLPNKSILRVGQVNWWRGQEMRNEFCIDFVYWQLAAIKSTEITLPSDLRNELRGGAADLRRRGCVFIHGQAYTRRNEWLWAPISTASIATSPSTATVTPTDDPELESVLHHHRGLQDQLSEELARMASQLKMNSLALGSLLKQDAKVRRWPMRAHAKQRLDTNF